MSNDSMFEPRGNPSEWGDVGALLVALFKLYEFGNNYIEAAQVLGLLNYVKRRLLTQLDESGWRGDDESYESALRKTIGRITQLELTHFLSSHGLWYLKGLLSACMRFYYVGFVCFCDGLIINITSHAIFLL